MLLMLVVAIPILVVNLSGFSFLSFSVGESVSTIDVHGADPYRMTKEGILLIL
jgi:hypothetical protein